MTGTDGLVGPCARAGRVEIRPTAHGVGQSERMDRPLDSDAAWAILPEPWKRCFELSWEAHQAGSLGVGAVVVDPSGAVIGAGRNRYVERDPPVGQLAGTYLAHAEVNALLSLPPGDYEQHVLYTSFEPCLLCTSALIHCHIGEVRYAATDHLWEGVQRLPELNDHVARRWPARTGPMPGPFAVWAAVLPLLWTLDRSPVGNVVAAHELRAPTVLDLARHLHRIKPAVLRQDSLAEALNALWGSLRQIDDQVTLAREVGPGAVPAVRQVSAGRRVPRR